MPNKIIETGLAMVGIHIHPGAKKRHDWSDEHLKERFAYLFGEKKKGATFVAVTGVPNYFVIKDMAELKAVWKHSHDGFAEIMEVPNETFEKIKASLRLTRVPMQASLPA